MACTGFFYFLMATKEEEKAGMQNWPLLSWLASPAVKLTVAILEGSEKTALYLYLGSEYAEICSENNEPRKEVFLYLWKCY